LFALYCSIYSLNNCLFFFSVVYLPSMSKIVVCRPIASGQWPNILKKWEAKNKNTLTYKKTSDLFPFQ